MNQYPKQWIDIGDFPGLVTNADGGGVPPGAAEEQINLMSNRVGELTSRPGLIQVTFEDE